MWFFDIFRRSLRPGSAERLLFGIGNPGNRYGATRHNIGYMVIEELAGRLAQSRRMQTCQAEVWSGVLAGEHRVVAAKPDTYVNLSGHSFRKLAGSLQIPLDSCLVISDDLHLKLGALRLRRGGSDGGHNGLKSIIGEVGREFPRLRIGVGPVPGGTSVIDFVLGEFEEQERPVVRETVLRAAAAAEAFCRRGMDAAMNEYNSG